MHTLSFSTLMPYRVFTWSLQFEQQYISRLFVNTCLPWTLHSCWSLHYVLQLQTHLSRAQYLILMCSVVLAYVYLPIIATLQSIYDLVQTDWPNIGQMDCAQLGHTYGVRKYSQYAYLCHLWRGDNTPPVPTRNTVDEMLRMWEFPQQDVHRATG